MLNRPIRVALLATGLLLGFGATSALAYSGSPPNGRTNAPGETNCTACHSSFPLNSGSGLLSVAGVNGSYQPGQTYDLVIDLEDPDASRWGFEFTVLGTDGNSVGSLDALDSHTQVSNGASRDYGKQTSVGTQNGTTGSADWTMRWTAPAEGTGDVTIYLVGNAANGNSSTSGDRIYAVSESWTEGTASAAPLALAPARLLPNYPNPFNPRTTIAFELREERAVRLLIYGVDGRLVRRLADEVRGEGHHEILWDGRDDTGRAAASGTYYYRLEAGDLQETRSMVLVR